MEARRKKASALRLRHSQSLASLSAAAKPGEGAFDDPALGQDDEAAGVTQSLDDLEVDARQNTFHRALEFRPLVASVGVELDQEREGAEQARHQQRAAVAVLNVGGMHDRVHQEALRIDKDVALLALDLLARIVAGRIDAQAPFFRALDALAVNDGGGRARLARGGLATPCVKRVVDAIERAVPAPQIEIIVDRRARRQVLGDRPPLAAGA